MPGSLWGHYIGIITSEHFNVMISIQYLSMIIIGGLGSIHGTIMGAMFMTLLPEVLRLISGLFSNQYPILVNIFGAIRESVFGLVIILFLIFEPDGLAAQMENDPELLETVALLLLIDANVRRTFLWYVC